MLILQTQSRKFWRKKCINTRHLTACDVILNSNGNSRIIRLVETIE